MKIARYEQDGLFYHGVLEGNTIRRISGSIFGEYRIEEQKISLEDVRLTAPVNPGKIIAIGLNYKKHAEEVNMALPEEPLLFLVSPTAVIGPQEKIFLKYPGHPTEHEGEIAIVIGKQAECISAEEASSYVLGYTCCNDVSDRLLQRKDGQFTRAKSFATYKPLGPCIATDLNPDQTAIRVKVNGEVRQESNTSDMIFSVTEIVSFVSHAMRLEPGDVIITGTPAGVGPLKHGDIVEVYIQGIGTLLNEVLS
ncbi:fumarylacetoacetate hydrolase family protein [Paenibacillus hemerocallicola]|uniref:Fumarylacetoacetate hydrolase family protein n=1 Tax=Paenibacillus hemerocallicola TaxID=1172614 RepID=A0A5C4TC87_9BACL|nr:fumarylacetoacetate hydrolase family protein [Paenibacillus hemerocallicola]TNJ66079.1 fumarylacetoacetate hydrolase family protein [Paenibacillus hemerocallicola]